MPNQIKTVNFGTQRTGLATIAYTLISTDGSTKQARTTTGVAEVATGTGIYLCLITFEALWEGIILWDDGQATKRYASDTYLKSDSADEIADAVWDEDITGHVTADTTGHRLTSIFKYVRAPGFGGGTQVVAKRVGALEDEDKEKIFKWFTTLLDRLKLLQRTIESAAESTKTSLTETEEKLKLIDSKTPEIDQIAQRIAPVIARSREISLSEFSTISNRLRSDLSSTFLKEIQSRIHQSTSSLTNHSSALFEKIRVKENVWEDLKTVIREQNNTEQILSTMHLFFSDSNKLKDKLDDLLLNVLKEAKLSNDILKGVGAQIQKDLSLSRINNISDGKTEPKHTLTLFSSINQIKTKIQEHLNSQHHVVLTTSSGQRIEVPQAPDSDGLVLQPAGAPPEKKEEQASLLNKFMLKFTMKKEDEPTREESVGIEMKKFGNWYLVRQPKGKKFNYVAQLHIRGESVHVDLRMEVNDHLVGVTLNTPEITEGSKQTQKDVMTTKNNKFLYPRSPSAGINYQMLTELKLVQPKVWLKIQGKIPPGGIGATKYKSAEFIIVSTGTVRFGTQKSDFHEWFLEPDGKHEWDKNIKGRWIHAWIPRPQHYKKAGEGKFMWGIFRSLKEDPYVTYHDFEKEKAKALKDKIDMIWQNPNGEGFQLVAGKGNLPKELKPYAEKP